VISARQTGGRRGLPICCNQAFPAPQKQEGGVLIVLAVTDHSVRKSYPCFNRGTALDILQRLFLFAICCNHTSPYRFCGPIP
jgi:hypothetical protein